MRRMPGSARDAPLARAVVAPPGTACSWLQDRGRLTVQLHGPLTAHEQRHGVASDASPVPLRIRALRQMIRKELTTVPSTLPPARREQLYGGLNHQEC